MFKLSRFAALLPLAAIAFAAQPAGAQIDGPSYVNCQYGFAIVYPKAPTSRDTTYKTMTGKTVPMRIFTLDQNGIKMIVSVAVFPDGPSVDEREMDFAADALKKRGEVRFLGDGAYDPGMPGRQLNIFEKANVQLRASVYMINRKLIITESLGPPGDFSALQFEQSIALIDEAGTDLDTNLGDPVRQYPCGK